MSDEEKLVTNFIHTGKHHEVALHRDDKMLHILRDNQHNVIWTEGVASAICGTMGYFSESHYIREMLIVLDKNRGQYCSECLDVLRRLRLSQYQTAGKPRDTASDMNVQDKVVSITESIAEYSKKKNRFGE